MSDDSVMNVLFNEAPSFADAAGGKVHKAKATVYMALSILHFCQHVKDDQNFHANQARFMVFVDPFGVAEILREKGLEVKISEDSDSGNLEVTWPV